MFVIIKRAWRANEALVGTIFHPVDDKTSIRRRITSRSALFTAQNGIYIFERCAQQCDYCARARVTPTFTTAGFIRRESSSCTQWHSVSDAMHNMRFRRGRKLHKSMQITKPLIRKRGKLIIRARVAAMRSSLVSPHRALPVRKYSRANFSLLFFFPSAQSAGETEALGSRVSPSPSSSSSLSSFPVISE